MATYISHHRLHHLHSCHSQRSMIAYNSQNNKCLNKKASETCWRRHVRACGCALGRVRRGSFLIPSSNFFLNFCEWGAVWVQAVYDDVRMVHRRTDRHVTSKQIKRKPVRIWLGFVCAQEWLQLLSLQLASSPLCALKKRMLVWGGGGNTLGASEKKGRLVSYKSSDKQPGC